MVKTKKGLQKVMTAVIGFMFTMSIMIIVFGIWVLIKVLQFWGII